LADGNGKGIWARLLIALIPLGLAGLIAMASLRSDMRHVEETLQTKANRETVEAQNRAVLQTLEDIRADLRELRRAVVKP
jgi:hypothetical protein